MGEGSLPSFEVQGLLDLHNSHLVFYQRMQALAQKATDPDSVMPSQLGQTTAGTGSPLPSATTSPGATLQGTQYEPDKK